MRLLELFSGTGSVGRPWREAGHEVISVDIDPRYSPEICEDILQLSYCKLAPVECIWSSPPCDQYSRARTRGPPRNLVLADSLVAKTIEIIKYFQTLNPDLIWFIENGDSTLLWGREIAKTLTKYVVVDYCQYNGPGYRKRTKIAHSDNILWNPRPLCDPKSCEQCVNGKHLKTAQRGRQSDPKQRRDNDTCTLDQLHGLPRQLTQEIYTICNREIWQVI